RQFRHCFPPPPCAARTSDLYCQRINAVSLKPAPPHPPPRARGIPGVALFRVPSFGAQTACTALATAPTAAHRMRPPAAESERRKPMKARTAAATRRAAETATPPPFPPVGERAG